MTKDTGSKRSFGFAETDGKTTVIYGYTKSDGDARLTTKRTFTADRMPTNGYIGPDCGTGQSLGEAMGGGACVYVTHGLDNAQKTGYTVETITYPNFSVKSSSFEYDRENEVSFAMIVCFHESFIVAADQRCTLIQDGVVEYKDGFQKILRIPTTDLFFVSTGQNKFGDRFVGEILSGFKKDSSSENTAESVCRFIAEEIRPNVSSPCVGYVIGYENDARVMARYRIEKNVHEISEITLPSGVHSIMIGESWATGLYEFVDWDDVLRNKIDAPAKIKRYMQGITDVCSMFRNRSIGGRIEMYEIDAVGVRKL
jgi:hypothetical protein